MQSYYHPTRQEAQAAADELMRTEPRVAYAKPELEPDNGWVVVAVPQVFDITALGDRFEVRHPNGRTLTNPPKDKVRFRLAQQQKAARKKAAAPKPAEKPRVLSGDERIAPPWARAGAPSQAKAPPAPAAQPRASTAPSSAAPPHIKRPWER